MEMLYHSVNDLIRLANEYQIPLWKVVLLADVQERQVTVEESFETMRQMYQAMRQADQGYDGSIVSASGMAGGDGEKLHAYNASGRSLAGGYMGLVMEKAVKMGESNACMKRIVAAPTAGACGVIPAVFLSYEEYCKETENRMVEALFVSAGIGAVIAENASIAGASGGCQAEIGAASAMAAGALVFLQGGDEEQISHGAAMALKNLLGLVCDPVAGLVEVPCVKRNVIGAVNALSSADMALAGITSRIPPDQVIDAMKEVGESMHVSLRETGEGGVANTPEARKIKEKLGM